MILVLPGMGADRRMFPGPWKVLPDCRFVDWPVYRGEKSISEIAHQILADQKVQDGDILVGASLGGIVACEISKFTPLGGVVLIGSAKNKEEISPFLARIHPLIDLMPLAFVQKLSGLVSCEITQMFSDVEAEFMRAMCSAIFTWEGLESAPSNLLRIHGRNDRVIPLPQGVQHVLDGGHLIAMTHPKECVEIIKKHQGMV